MAKFLGIDTSCYTTSVAIYDERKGLVAEERIMLTVKQGRRGLAQSEMVFQHVRNLPVLMQRISPWLSNLAGIGVSVFPRRRADSYMPAFLVGKGLAQTLAVSHQIPIVYFSHQENHVLAAIRSVPDLWGKDMYMMHLSGGTHDVLHVTWRENEMKIVDVLHSSDITAGQLIDRIGVAMGMRFPAGKCIEAEAEKASFLYPCHLPRAKDMFSYSGVETQLKKIIDTGRYDVQALSQTVLVAIGQSLDQVLGEYDFLPNEPFIAVGGVMSNGYLRQTIRKNREKRGMSVYFAEPCYSSDNATGNAFGAYMTYLDGGI